MNYLIKLILSLKEIIITYILQYLIIIISCMIYLKISSKSIAYFINNYCTYILIITYIIFIIYLYKKNKIKEKKTNYKKVFIYISLGISLSCILNMIIFMFYKPTITNKIPPLLLLISSGIIGPIYEEILFRYVFYNKIRKLNSANHAILLNTLIFALIHLTIRKITFTFLLGLIINIVYEKNKNITYPIIIHMSANIISLLLYNYEKGILVLAIFLFLISLINIKEDLWK